MIYTYRTTSRDLSDSWNRIEAEGDAVVQARHMGGRDWLLVCRKEAESAAVKADVSGYTDALRRGASASGDLDRTLANLEARVHRGARRKGKQA